TAVAGGTGAAAFSTHEPHPPVAVREPANHLEGGVPRAVVHDDHLDLAERLVQDAAHRSLDVGLGVSARDHHADHGAAAPSPYRTQRLPQRCAEGSARHAVTHSGRTDRESRAEVACSMVTP